MSGNLNVSVITKIERFHASCVPGGGRKRASIAFRKAIQLCWDSRSRSEECVPSVPDLTGQRYSLLRSAGASSPLMAESPHSEHKQTPLRIFVVGAGLGGLAAAASLRRQGHRVEVRFLWFWKSK
jgi:hypothetical protein